MTPAEIAAFRAAVDRSIALGLASKPPVPAVPDQAYLLARAERDRLAKRRHAEAKRRLATRNAALAVV
jgi:hypothetical protein